MEPPMHALDTYNLVMNVIALVMMPLIIWANLRNSGIKSPLHAYLWREHPKFMRVALLIIVMVTLFAGCSLLANFGLISPAAEETIAMVIGIPFMVASVAIIGLAIAAALKALRLWRARRSRS
jgi:hypothetical protein